MSGFDDAWKENRHVWESTKNLAKAMYLAGTQSRQAEIDELQKRVNEHNRKLNIFIDELKKTHNDNNDNKIDYWRGFSECADSSVQVFLRDVGFID